ncbi:macrophage mannose receptor 1-like [Cherax quadricarinatus]|uniref:macrophage mannose receptor 1-like n=1 Tax=Cherax quadricarinatus TaxID=27406 RepID=UPI00387E987A
MPVIYNGSGAMFSTLPTLTMKIVVLLVLLGLVVCELPPPHFNRFFQRQPQPVQPRPPPFQRPFQGGSFQTRPRFQSPTRPAPQRAPSGAAADATLGRSEYYFSWRHDGGRKYTGTEAARVCTSLGRGWQPIGISSREEIAFVISVVGGDNVEYIWTGGVRTGNGDEFVWQNGEPFTVENWSHTGGFGRPQPDNRESGNENCLSVLNNFYQDGIKWHDVACHHLKPVICERHI